jgi:hypothetical protein
MCGGVCRVLLISLLEEFSFCFCREKGREEIGYVSERDVVGMC